MWLEPKLVAQIDYAERTRDGRLRHPSFKGLREDKPAREVHRERAEDEEARMAKTSVAGCQDEATPASTAITLTNPDRVLLSRYRPHQARSRPLLRDRRALHAALRRATADQPGALPGRHRQGVLLPAPRHEGHEQGDQGGPDRGRREQEEISLYRRRGGSVRTGADRRARDPRLGRVARPHQRARPHRVRSRSRRGASTSPRSKPPRSRCATSSPISASRAFSNRPAARACMSSRRSRRSSAGPR